MLKMLHYFLRRFDVRQTFIVKEPFVLKGPKAGSSAQFEHIEEGTRRIMFFVP